MKGFGAEPSDYNVVITWKHGFTHSYEQKLTPKQLESEQERLANYRWIANTEFNLLTDS